MKSGYTHISVVLDKSGSMGSILNDTIGGFNVFLNTQKEAPGEATFSLTTFNTMVHLNYGFKPIGSVEELSTASYTPGGGTALYDAIGLTINGCGEKLAAMKEADRPEKVILVIITDGEENSSREFSYQKVQEMIKNQQDKYSWEFVFLGANIDAKRIGANLGVKLGNSMTFAANTDGVGDVFGSMAMNMTSYRSMSVGEAKCSKFFNAEDEAKQLKAGIKQ